jgi:hypothetical protein
MIPFGPDYRALLKSTMASDVDGIRTRASTTLLLKFLASLMTGRVSRSRIAIALPLVIRVENPTGVQRGVEYFALDGKELEQHVSLSDDGQVDSVQLPSCPKMRNRNCASLDEGFAATCVFNTAWKYRGRSCRELLLGTQLSCPRDMFHVKHRSVPAFATS